MTVPDHPAAEQGTPPPATHRERELYERYGPRHARLLMQGDASRPGKSVLGSIVGAAARRKVPLAVLLADLRDYRNAGGLWYRREADSDRKKTDELVRFFYSRSGARAIPTAASIAAGPLGEALYYTLRSRWPGRLERSAQKVMKAGIELAAISGGRAFGAADRDYAMTAGIAERTLKPATTYLQRHGLLDKTFTGDFTSPSAYKLPEDVAARLADRCSAKVTPYNEYLYNNQGRNGNCSYAATLAAYGTSTVATAILAHPAFRDGTGLSEPIYLLLRHDRPLPTSAGADVTGHAHRSALRCLHSLAEQGLAERIPAGWVRLGGVDELDRAAVRLDAQRRAEAQRRRIERDRQQFQQMIAEAEAAASIGDVVGDGEPDLADLLAEIDNDSPCVGGERADDVPVEPPVAAPEPIESTTEGEAHVAPLELTDEQAQQVAALLDARGEKEADERTQPAALDMSGGDRAGLVDVHDVELVGEWDVREPLVDPDPFMQRVRRVALGESDR